MSRAGDTGDDGKRGFDRDDALLEAYLDGELGSLRRRWLEGRLARSAPLRARLAEIERASAWIRDAAMATESTATPDLWPELASDLAAVDREIDSQPGAGFARWVSWLRPTPVWPSLAAAAILALVVLSSFSGLLDGGLEGWMAQRAGTSPDGALRYLNTEGRPVLVSQDGEGTTIIWLMDSSADST